MIELLTYDLYFPVWLLLLMTLLSLISLLLQLHTMYVSRKTRNRLS